MQIDRIAQNMLMRQNYIRILLSFLKILLTISCIRCVPRLSKMATELSNFDAIYSPIPRPQQNEALEPVVLPIYLFSPMEIWDNETWVLRYFILWLKKVHFWLGIPCKLCLWLWQWRDDHTGVELGALLPSKVVVQYAIANAKEQLQGWLLHNYVGKYILPEARRQVLCIWNVD